MDRVLVPYDFSPHARRACALAMQGVPFGMHVGIEMLHVIDEELYANLLASKYVPSTDAIDSYLDDELIRIRAEIAVAHGSDQPKLLAPRRVITRGRPHVIIDDRLHSPGVVGALLGGQGHGGSLEHLLGRTAQRVVRHAGVPVLVVKNPTTFSPPTRLVAAVDWSSSSARALLFAARVRDEQAGLLSILHVVDSPFVPYVQGFAHERDAREALDRLREEQLVELAHFVDRALSGFSGSREAHTLAVVFGDPASTIASQAQTLLAQLIVVGAHGATDLSRYLLGSTAEKLVATASCDVLVVP